MACIGNMGAPRRAAPERSGRSNLKGGEAVPLVFVCEVVPKREAYSEKSGASLRGDVVFRGRTTVSKEMNDRAKGGRSAGVLGRSVEWSRRLGDSNGDNIVRSRRSSTATGTMIRNRAIGQRVPCSCCALPRTAIARHRQAGVFSASLACFCAAKAESILSLPPAGFLQPHKVWHTQSLFVVPGSHLQDLYG